jgi:epoxyqueuosine reductase
MANRNDRGILHSREPLGPLPMERIRRVDDPTTVITDGVQRIDLRNIAYDVARRGEYGRAVQKGVQKSLPGKYPLSAAQKDIMDHLALVSLNGTAGRVAPIPDEPEVLTRHIKALGYFFKADIMGACTVPQSAYYSHDKQGVALEPRYENAIIIVMGKDWNAVRASTGSDWIGDPISFQAYQHLGLVT